MNKVSQVVQCSVMVLSVKKTQEVNLNFELVSEDDESDSICTKEIIESFSPLLK